MLRAPSWITSATSTTGSMSRASISSVTIGSPVSALASASRRRPSCPRPWKEYGRRARLVGAAAEQARAAGRDRAARRSCTWSRDSTVHGPAMRLKWSPPILRPSISTTVRSFGRSWRGGELEGLEDRDDLGDAVVALEAEAGDVLAVADRADHRHLLPARGMGSSAAGLDAGDDGLHLLLGGRRFHHDHHGTAGSPGNVVTWVTADGAALGPGARLPDGGGCEGPRRPSA